MKKILKKACFAAKCRFHERLFEQFQNNSKKIWRAINHLTGRKKRDKNTIQTLKLADGSVTSNSKTIANALNEYFVNIGREMSSQLPPAPVSHQQFLKNYLCGVHSNHYHRKEMCRIN